MPKRRNHEAGFKARVALEAVKGERTVSELAADCGVQPDRNRPAEAASSLNPPKNCPRIGEQLTLRARQSFPHINGLRAVDDDGLATIWQPSTLDDPRMGAVDRQRLGKADRRPEELRTTRKPLAGEDRPGAYA